MLLFFRKNFYFFDLLQIISSARGRTTLQATWRMLSFIALIYLEKTVLLSINCFLFWQRNITTLFLTHVRPSDMCCSVCRDKLCVEKLYLRITVCFDYFVLQFILSNWILCVSEGKKYSVVLFGPTNGEEVSVWMRALNLNLALESSILYPSFLSRVPSGEKKTKKTNETSKPHSWGAENVILIFCLVWCPFSLTIKFQVISEEMLSAYSSLLQSTLLMSTIWKAGLGSRKDLCFWKF